MASSIRYANLILCHAPLSPFQDFDKVKRLVLQFVTPSSGDQIEKKAQMLFYSVSKMFLGSLEIHTGSTCRGKSQAKLRKKYSLKTD